MSVTFTSPAQRCGHADIAGPDDQRAVTAENPHLTLDPPVEDEIMTPASGRMHPADAGAMHNTNPTPGVHPGEGVRMKMVSRRRSTLSAAVLVACALCALAFVALPAMASANVTFEKAGAALKVGAKVTGISSNFQTMTSWGTVKCTTTTLNSTVKANQTEPAILNPGTGAASGCTAGGLEMKIESILFEPFEFFADHTAKTKRFKYTYTLVGVATGCFLEGPATSTWTPGSSAVVFRASVSGGGGGLCPTSGSLSGEFKLSETATKALVTIN